MSNELSAFCRTDGFVLSGNELSIRFESGRRHVVAITEQADHYLLRAVVVRRVTVKSMEQPEIWSWRRNRSTSLVGFRIDEQRRLLAESWVPRAGLTAGEFQMYARHLAAEADRVEHLLSGRDAE